MNAQAQTILLVDDEPGQRQLISAMLQRAGYAVLEAENGALALALLRGADAPTIDAVILDQQMPVMNGTAFLEALRPACPSLPVVMLTAEASLATAVCAMRAGATDYLIKPARADRLLAALESALAGRHDGGELQPLSEKLPVANGFDQIIGKAPAFQATLAIAAKVARAAVPVLIDGESGVGKEVVAHAIHTASPRAKQPLVIVNCGAIPANLVESVLFGHEKGAFTGAVSTHVGRFGEADGGTLFLDEIGELPLDAQVKLLRALQTGQIEPVGGRGAIAVDVRIIAATNRDLATEVVEGRFREDLFYRLNVVPLTIPPLRERQEDIPALADCFLKRLAAGEGTSARRITAEALALLCAYDWPGNVRQLQNALFRAAVLCDGPALTVADFPQILSQSQRVLTHKPVRSGHNVQIAPMQNGVALFDSHGHIRPLDAIEADIIRHALQHYRGQMSEVARRLGIGRSTLYRKLAELGLTATA